MIDVVQRLLLRRLHVVPLQTLLRLSLLTVTVVRLLLNALASVATRVLHHQVRVVLVDLRVASVPS